MIFDILLQVLMILATVFSFLYMHEIPQNLVAKFRNRDTADHQAKRHFVRGAQLLSQARSPSISGSDAAALAKQAEDEAEKAILLDAKDAAAHILKALALDLQGFKASALDSLDAALSPLAAKSLSERERGDALVKRAELVMGMDRREGRVDSAIEDLTRAVELSQDNAKAFCLLGVCYEAKKMRGEAKAAFEEALKLEPGFPSAREGLDQLAS